METLNEILDELESLKGTASTIYDEWLSDEARSILSTAYDEILELRDQAKGEYDIVF